MHPASSQPREKYSHGRGTNPIPATEVLTHMSSSSESETRFSDMLSNPMPHPPKKPFVANGKNNTFYGFSLPLHSIQPAYPAHCPEASRSLSRDPKNCWAVTKAVTSPSTAGLERTDHYLPGIGPTCPKNKTVGSMAAKGKNETRLNICTLR